MALFPTATTAFPNPPWLATGTPIFSFQSSTSDQSLQGLAPPAVVSTITPTWLRNLFSLIPESERERLSSLTDADLTLVSQLQYGGEPSMSPGQYVAPKLVLSLDDSEVTMELLGFLRTSPVEQVVTDIRQCKDRSDLLWLAHYHREGYLAVAREAFILQVEESGIKGLVKCRRCQSSNVLMMSKQLRSGDEPTTIFTRCIDCKETWKQ